MDGDRAADTTLPESYTYNAILRTLAVLHLLLYTTDGCIAAAEALQVASDALVHMTAHLLPHLTSAVDSDSRPSASAWLVVSHALPLLHAVLGRATSGANAGVSLTWTLLDGTLAVLTRCLQLAVAAGTTSTTAPGSQSQRRRVAIGCAGSTLRCIEHLQRHRDLPCPTEVLPSA